MKTILVRDKDTDALLAAPRGYGTRFVWLALAALMAGFFVFTYLHLEDPSQWISWSAGRVFSPLLALLAVAAACGPSEAARQ